jgi:hypothetical protein
MIKIRFSGSNNLRDKRVTIKNTGKVIVKASLFVKNILNRKKKKELTIIFIIIIIIKLEGGVVKVKIMINPIKNNKKISFFGKISLASLMNFNYNGKLWLK